MAALLHELNISLPQKNLKIHEDPFIYLLKLISEHPKQECYGLWYCEQIHGIYFIKALQQLSIGYLVCDIRYLEILFSKYGSAKYLHYKAIICSDSLCTIILL